MRRRALVAVTLLLALVAGCSALGSLNETRGTLRDAGYEVDKVRVTNTNGRKQLGVTWRPDARSTDELARERQDITRLLWESVHGRFDTLYLVARDMSVPEYPSHEATLHTRAQLEAELGPRDPALDSDAFDMGVDGKVLAATGVVALLVLLGVPLLAWWVVRHNRGKRAEEAGQQAGNPFASPPP